MQRKQLNSGDVQDLVKQAAKFNSRVLDDRARRVHLSDVNPAVSLSSSTCVCCLVSFNLFALCGQGLQLLLQAHWIRSKHFLSKQQEREHKSVQHSGHVYPASILPGQYSDSINRYSPKELDHLPVNTVITPLPPLSLRVEGPGTIHSKAANVCSSGEQQCSGENIIEGMELAEQLTANTAISVLVCMLVDP